MSSRTKILSQPDHRAQPLLFPALLLKFCDESGKDWGGGGARESQLLDSALSIPGSSQI